MIQSLKKQRVGLFGGSFNPPHRGHAQVVEYLVESRQFDEIWLLPTYDHPFEKDLAPFRDRVKMCEQWAQNLSQVQICAIEGELKFQPSYTVDVVGELNQRYPKIDFHLIVGSDVKKDLDRWKEIETLKKRVHFYFIPRAGFDNSSFMEIASHEVRQMISAGEDFHPYVVDPVAQYIDQEGLYQKR